MYIYIYTHTYCIRSHCMLSLHYLLRICLLRALHDFIVRISCAVRLLSAFASTEEHFGAKRLRMCVCVYVYMCVCINNDNMNNNT